MSLQSMLETARAQMEYWGDKLNKAPDQTTMEWRQRMYVQWFNAAAVLELAIALKERGL